MTWDYRVIRRVNDGSYGHVAAGTEHYSIHEVFYEDDGTAVSWSDPSAPYGDTVEDLRADLAAHLAALDVPVLDEAELIAARDRRD